MDWNAAIEKNREALKKVLAVLLAMAGLESGQSAIGGRQSGSTRAADGASSDCLLPTADCRFLPRHLHRAILRLLRPAEAAARRLVIVAARGMVVSPRPLRPARPAAPASAPRRKPKPGSAPGLPLFDPLPRWRRRWRNPSGAMPRISVPGFTAPAPIRPPPTPFDPVDAARLAARLAALGRALDDLPRQARRFALWQARGAEAARAAYPSPCGEGRREAAGWGACGGASPARPAIPRSASMARRTPQKEAGPCRSRRVWPLRPGRPPGRPPLRGLPPHEVHDILAAVHDLALWALEPADTS